MRNETKNLLELPLPVSAEKQAQKVQASRSKQSPLESVMDDDFPSQSSLHFTGVRVITLVVVLIGVTLSMLMSFFFLFSGANLHLSLPAFSFPFSLSVMSLLGAGSGVGIVLLIVCVLIVQRNKKEIPTQSHSIGSATSLVSSENQTLFPPEPFYRHTDELDLFGLDIPGDQWNAAGWDGELRKKTDTLEALHTRQRLRSLRLSYVDDFLRDNDEKNSRDQIKKVNRRVVTKRKTGVIV